MLAMEQAMGRLSAIPFFPSNDAAVLEIMHQVEAMIGTKELYGSTPQERLDWLVNAAVNAMQTWNGVPELRGLLCSKWKPADGLEGFSTLKGYRPTDSEGHSIKEHDAYRAVEAGKAPPKPPKLLGPAGERMPAAELAQLHNDTIGKLLETTKWPRRSGKSPAALERELADAPKRHLTDEEKVRRMRELEASLGLRRGDDK
jgi:hypothetical protein